MEDHGPAVQPAGFRIVALVARWLHRGYAIVPVSRSVNPRVQKYSTLPKFGFGVCVVHPGSPRGAIMCRHASRAGLAVDAAASAREARAGRVVPVSPRLRATSGAARLRLVCKFPASSTGPGKTAAKWRAVRTAKPCGPGRRCHGQVLAKVRASPTGQTASSNSRGEGGQKEWSAPGRSRHKPSDHRAGKAE
ncbi:hypothetical protein ABIF61_002259 [Bradyrhizobium japonicum]